MIPVILSGGSGTRLWPLSRKHKPKQFLKLFGDNTMFQQTLMRLEGIEKLQMPIVVSNEEHRFMVAEQLQESGIKDSAIILEPCGKNTAPAITIASLHALESDVDPIMLVLAADHIIQDIDVFHKVIMEAEVQANQDKLVTFGITPTSAHTGYGYIQACDEGVTSMVKSFTEKPDSQTAQIYLDSGEYYWNSGMFMFKASVLVKELEKHAPEILSACTSSLRKSQKDLDFIRIDREAFDNCPSNSFDYAVMEKTKKSVVVPLDAGWSDVGSWESLWESTRHDQQKNVLQGDVLIDGVENSFVHSETRLVTVLGLDDVVVVETADAVLVSSKRKAQDIRGIVQKLIKSERTEAENSLLCHRPWGHYTTIDSGKGFQVKRITVTPGSALSLQLHHHRAEHWVVVKGTARVTCEDKIVLLSENESTFIPLGKKHRLENPGQLPLEIIEIQSGAYLGEDDIVRFEDDYHRA